MTDDARSGYGLSEQKGLGTFPAPELPYAPPTPSYKPKIGLIGCGGITEYHLRAYKNAGLDVVALCDIDLERCKARQAEFYPDAQIGIEPQSIFDDDEIDVVDIATHPDVRIDLVKRALDTGKHVLSQKPFAKDLDTARELIAYAAERKLHLAVNQNGRFAPHFSYIRQAIAAGHIGAVCSVDFTLHWDHNWTVETPFDAIHHLILYDFAIHWFDMASVFFGGQEAERVFASIAKTPSQQGSPPYMAHVVADFPTGQATFVFNADCPFGQEDRTVVTGTKGVLRSVGPSITEQMVTLHTEAGTATPTLTGDWFTNGFEGCMTELLCAIEEDRVPMNDAKSVLPGLALCFAACDSADSGAVLDL